MSLKSNSQTENRKRWAPLGGFVTMSAGSTLVASEVETTEGESKEKPEAKTENDETPAEHGAEESGIVGTSTLKPEPVSVNQSDWKPLSVGAAVFFALSAFMCVLIFKIYANRKLV